MKKKDYDFSLSIFYEIEKPISYYTVQKFREVGKLNITDLAKFWQKITEVWRSAL